MKEPVYFLKLELENVACFGEKAMLDLSDGKGNWKQWTVILGDNGVGKTSLLKVLACFDIDEQNAIFTPGLAFRNPDLKIEKEQDFINEMGIARIYLNIYKDEKEFKGPKLYYSRFDWFASNEYTDNKLNELRLVG